MELGELSGSPSILSQLGDPSGELRMHPEKVAEYVTLPARTFVTAGGGVTTDAEQGAYLLGPKGALVPRALAASLGIESEDENDGPEDDDGNGVVDGLELLTLAELRDLAKSQGVEGADTMRRVKLRSLITPVAVSEPPILDLPLTGDTPLAADTNPLTADADTLTHAAE